MEHRNCLKFEQVKEESLFKGQINHVFNKLSHSLYCDRCQSLLATAILYPEETQVYNPYLFH